MARVSIIRKTSTLISKVSELPQRGLPGVIYILTTTGRAYSWNGSKYRLAEKCNGAPRYNGVYCKVSCLEFAEIASPTPINWEIGDFVYYPRTGLTYKLYDIPQPKKQARTEEYGGGFIYSNVQFFPDTKWLEIEPFRDLVLDDEENIHFTTQASWSVYTNAANLIDRFNAVMQAAHPGEWLFRLVSSADEYLQKLLYDTWFNFTISGESVLQGLNKLYDLCGNIGWVHTVETIEGRTTNVITVGIPPIYRGVGETTAVYCYGVGKGLKEIRKSTTNRNELKTRLFAYGSTRNMIPRYYNGLNIKDAESVYIPNLMLPLSEWGTTEGQKDASKAYIEKNTDLYGIRPETVYFDGSNGRKEIYPSIAETTIGNLYDAMPSGSQYRPDLSKHGRGTRLDEIEGVSGLDDDGQRGQGGERYFDSQTVTVTTWRKQVTGNFEIDLFRDVECLKTGSVTIPLKDIVAGHEGSPLTRTNINGKVIVNIGGRTYTTGVEVASVDSAVRFLFTDFTAPCNEGDLITATLVVSFQFTSLIPADYFYIEGGDIKFLYSNNLANEFIITIPQIGFDIGTRARLGTQGIATVAFTDGKCGGRSFVVKSAKYNSEADSWELAIYRGLDESLDLLFPNTTYPIEIGNHFVLLDIAMPDIYIGMAEQKLLAAAEGLLNDISSPKPFYEPMIDAKFLLEKEYILREGWYMLMEDADILDNTESVLIDTLTINENESNIPTYKVTLREQKRAEYSSSQSVGGQLTSLASGINTPTESGGLTPSQKAILENLDSWFGEDGSGNIFVKNDKDGNARNFYSFGCITAGGVGTPAPSPVMTIGSLSNVTDSADSSHSEDKILVKRAYSTEWALATFSEITGGIAGVSMNGALMPITNNIVNLGTVITAHQSLSAYRTAALQDKIDEFFARSITAIEDTLETFDERIATLEEKSAMFELVTVGGVQYIKALHSLYSEGSISAGGIGGGGGGGGVGGIDTIIFGTKSYTVAHEGDTTLTIPVSGMDSVKEPLGISALESSVANMQRAITAIKRITDRFQYDSANNAIRALIGLYSDSFISAGGIGGSGGGGSTVEWEQIYEGSASEQIATITIDGQDHPVYAPAGGSPSQLATLTIGRKTYNGTSAVTVASTDITRILGYTPVNPTALSNYQSKITTASKLPYSLVKEGTRLDIDIFIQDGTKIFIEYPRTLEAVASSVEVELGRYIVCRGGQSVRAGIYDLYPDGGGWKKHKGWTRLGDPYYASASLNTSTSGYTRTGRALAEIVVSGERKERRHCTYVEFESMYELAQTFLGDGSVRHGAKRVQRAKWGVRLKYNGVYITDWMPFHLAASLSHIVLSK